MDVSRKWISNGPLPLLALVASLVASGLPAASAWAVDTYRWVDPETGKWEYAPTPPGDPDQPYVLMRDGRIIGRYMGSERLEPPESEFEAERAAAEAKAKADALLLVQFKQIGEIDIAMQVELDNLRYDYRLLDGTYDSMEKSLFEQIEVAANRQRAGLEVATHKLEQIESLRGRMNANRLARVELSERESRIREEFDLMKDRYRELIQARPRS